MAGALNEFDLIARYLRPLALDPGALGLKDDAAVLSVPPGQELVMTADAIVAGVHFLPDDPPDLVARKLLRVNLSDLAAKGARPAGYLMTIAWPHGLTEAMVAQFVAGLAQDQAGFGIALLGGDTVMTPGPWTLSVTAFGHVAAGGMRTRTGAKPGDEVWITGTIGDGAFGLLAAQGSLPQASAEDQAYLANRYHLPQPRLEFGVRLGALASAGLDVSDGLIADLGHLLNASGTGARIDIGRVPLSPALWGLIAGDPVLLRQAVTGGDDYELCFTAPPAASQDIRALAAESGLKVTVIGQVTREQGLCVTGLDGTPMTFEAGGYRHFGMDDSL